MQLHIHCGNRKLRRHHGNYTVTAKDDLGHSPKFGDIRKGQKYTIEETDFAPELFNAPDGFDLTPYLPQPESAVVDDTVVLDDPTQSINTYASEEVL